MEAKSNVTAIAPPTQASQLQKFNPENFWPKDWEDGLRYATILAKAPSLLPKHVREAKNPAEEVFAHIMFGFEVGLAPLQALQAIYIVNGRKGMYAADQVALILKHPDCEKMECIEANATRCTWVTKRRGRAEQRLTFTMEQATKAGLTRNEKYQSDPENMLRWRCATRLLAFTWPDVLRGTEDREAIEEEKDAGGWVERVSPPPAPPAPGRPQAQTVAPFNPPEHVDETTGEVTGGEAPPADDFTRLSALMERCGQSGTNAELLALAAEAGKTKMTDDQRSKLLATYAAAKKAIVGRSGGQNGNA